MKKHTTKILIGLIILVIVLFALFSCRLQAEQAANAKNEEQRIHQQNQQVISNDQAITRQMNQLMQQIQRDQTSKP